MKAGSGKRCESGKKKGLEKNKKKKIGNLAKGGLGPE